jgi:hypothetical protein
MSDQREDGTLRDLHATGNPDNRFSSADGGNEGLDNQFGAKVPTSIAATGERPKMWGDIYNSLTRSKEMGKFKGPYLSRG